MLRFSGLKVSIAVTVLALLITSMVLGNFVTIMFWKKNLTDLEITHSRYIATITAGLIRDRLSNGGQINSAVLEKLALPFGHKVQALVFYDGSKGVSFPSEEENGRIIQLARNAGMLQEDSITADGSVWNLFSLKESSVTAALPVTVEKQKNSALAVQVQVDSIFQIIKGDLKTVLVYLLVNVLILFVIGWYRLVRSVVKPIERMVAVSESYNLSEDIFFTNDEAGSEFGQLSMALNSMLVRIELDREELRTAVASLERVNRELVETQKEMIFAEKHASVGRLAAGLAHEVGNPLGIVQGYVELLKQDDISTENKEMYADRALSELDRINALIRHLLDFARAPKMTREITSIIPIVTELTDMLGGQNRAIAFTVNSLVQDVELFCDRDGIRQVLLNCYLNAIDAIESCSDGRHGVITTEISEYTTDKGAAGRLIITIADNGIGIAEESAMAIFEPFYTTKEPGKGTGLGLSVSHSIIEAHNGTMILTGSEGSGATVTIELPVSTKSGNEHG